MHNKNLKKNNMTEMVWESYSRFAYNHLGLIEKKFIFQNYNKICNNTIVDDIEGWPERYLPMKCWPSIVTINIAIFHGKQTKKLKNQ